MNKIKAQKKPGKNTPEFLISPRHQTTIIETPKTICFKKSFNLSFANSDDDSENSDIVGRAEGVSHTSNILNDKSNDM